MVLPIVGKGGGGATAAGRGARGHVAPAVVAGPVGLRLASDRRASRACGIETGQLMGLAAVAVEVLVGASAVVGALPQLAQVRVGIGIAVTGSAVEAVGGVAATGAAGLALRRAGVTGPDQSIVSFLSLFPLPQSSFRRLNHPLFHLSGQFFDTAIPIGFQD